MKKLKLRPYAFLIEPQLAVALKALKMRDGIGEGEAIRRALRAFLIKKGILARPKQKK